MKRDMNLIRLLLMQLEEESAPLGLDKYSEAQQIYHLVLLVEAGLIKGVPIEDENGDEVSVSVNRLTWAGHEFLDSARNETVWAKTTRRIKDSGIEVTMSVLKELLTQAIFQQVGLTGTR